MYRFAAAWWDWAVRLCLAAAAAAYGFTWVCVLAGTPSNKRLRQLLFVCLRVLFSLVRCIGKLLYAESAISRAYIQVLNHLVLRRPLCLPPRQVLLLAPHCLQWDQCPHKITRNVQNCRRCGRCPIGEMTASVGTLGHFFRCRSRRNAGPASRRGLSSESGSSRRLRARLDQRHAGRSAFAGCRLAEQAAERPLLQY